MVKKEMEVANMRDKARWILLAVGLAMALAALIAQAGDLQEKIDTLWGSRITIRELLEETCPEMLSLIRVQDQDVLVTWGDEIVFRPDSDDAMREDEEQERFYIYIHCTVSIRASGHRVTYGASNTVTIPPLLRMPYMAVTAFLREDGSIIEATSDYGYDVWRVTTNDSSYVAGNANYQTMSYHYVVAPPGYSPSPQFTVRYSQVIHVD